MPQVHYSGIGGSLQDFFYRNGLLKEIEFNLPVISVGNLSIGGAGKTPHIEYLIRLLKDYIEVSTLSRGYKRKTKGFQVVQSKHTAESVGDEPLQFKRKYPEILVTVSESRTFGIPEIVKIAPQTQVVLLDDAFQHRSVKPGLNILLTEFNHPFTRDYLLPSGRLREWRTAYRRADIIILSKCPPTVSEGEKKMLIDEIKPLAYQKIYFSYYDYLPPYYLFNSKHVTQLQADWDVLLICAIAGTDYLVEYLESNVRSVRVLEYEDHHYFTESDVANLKQKFHEIPSSKKLILTTEKDAMRFEEHQAFLMENQLPVFSLPVEVKFHFDEGLQFDQVVKDYLLNFRV